MNMKKISALLALAFVSSNASSVINGAEILGFQNAAYDSNIATIDNILGRLATMPTESSPSIHVHNPFAFKQAVMDHTGGLFGNGNPTFGGAMTHIADSLGHKSTNTSQNSASSASGGNTNTREANFVSELHLLPTHTETHTNTNTEATM
jgi:hypothetical protein